MATASKVDICNLGLVNTGHRTTISSLTEVSNEASLCNLYYPRAVAACLSDHHWNFAKTIVTLALSGTAPTGWDYQYTMPTDCIEMWSLVDPSFTGDDNDDMNRVPFQIGLDSATGNPVIWTNLETAQARYTMRVDDPAVYSEPFVDALGFRLALFLAIPITSSPAVVNSCMAGYNASLAAAKVHDARQGYQIANNKSEWHRDR